MDDVPLVWSGAAAAAATAELATVSSRARRALSGVAGGARVLRQYADELEQAQSAARRLQHRACAVEADHEREVSAARVHVLDPAERSRALAAAQERRADGLRRVHRAYGAVRDDLTASSRRCTLALERLSRSAVDAVSSRTDGDLPLTRELVRAGLTPPTGTVDPPPERHWWDDVADGAVNGAVWTWNNAVVPLVNGAADVAEAASEHPEDLTGIAAGIGAMLAGAAGDGAGAALAATGVGAVPGVALAAVSTSAIVAGGTAAAASALDLARHAAAKDAMLLKEVSLRRGTRGMGGDPVPDSERPTTAGSAWPGRISNDGNGRVWQRPEDICPPPKICAANSIRINDPGSRWFSVDGVRTEVFYPHGYVRFYNSTGQPLRPDGRVGNQADTHFPIRPNGSYDIPKGWNPL